MPYLALAFLLHWLFSVGVLLCFMCYGTELRNSDGGQHRRSLAVVGIGLLSLHIILFFSLDKVSLCSPGCPGTLSVDQAGLKLTEICPSPVCWD